MTRRNPKDNRPQRRKQRRRRLPNMQRRNENKDIARLRENATRVGFENRELRAELARVRAEMRRLERELQRTQRLNSMRLAQTDKAA